jgi:MoxR-like ATPase
VSDSHILLEGNPGLAKTRASLTFAKIFNLQFKRIQFTPDLMPTDIIGTQIFNPKDNTFATEIGPIFANIVLADEINRAPAKVQSALLESMQEKTVTIAKKSYPLPSPFIVIATQNPIEQEGTYPLPEAQLDRFMMKIKIDYPAPEDELKMAMNPKQFDSINVSSTMNAEILTQVKKNMEAVRVDESLMHYVVNLVAILRDPAKYNHPELAQFVAVGPSPRATLAFIRGLKACAVIEGRDYATPDDLKFLILPTLRHRIQLTFEAIAEGKTTDGVISDLVNQLTLP